MKFRSKARSSKFCNPRVRNQGFTLIEMVVVISMILILLSIALPMYNQSVIRAREATLRQNLATLNKVIDQYTLDKQKAPQSLEDLVSGSGLGGISQVCPERYYRQQGHVGAGTGRLAQIHRPDPARHCGRPQRLRPSGHRWHPLFELGLLSQRPDA